MHVPSPPDLLFSPYNLLDCECGSAVDRMTFIACIQKHTFHTEHQKVKISLALIFVSVYPPYILLPFYSSLISTFIIFCMCNSLLPPPLKDCCMFELCFLHPLVWLSKVGHSIHEVSGRCWPSSKVIDLLQKQKGTS